MEVPQGNFLTVDDGGRPRANSDPTVGTGVTLPLLLPEITVEDCGDSELLDVQMGGEQGGLFGLDATPRPRANTCPEDLFRRKPNGRPPTPPPGTFRKDRRFKSGFSKPVLKESVSFTHHKLSKLTETEDAEEPHGSSSSPWETSATSVEPLGSAASHTVVVRPATNFAEGLNGEDPDWFRSGSAAGVTGESRSADNQCPSMGGAKTSTGDSMDSGNADHFLTSSSVKCRFTQTKPRSGLDSTQLQAC